MAHTSITKKTLVEFLAPFNDVNSLLLSVDETKTFVKWEGETIPTSVDSLTTKEGPYHYQNIWQISIEGC